MVKTLIRLTNRALTTDEIESLRNLFPVKNYPLLTISPRHSNQILKPLYEENLLPFVIPIINKTFK